MYKYVPFIIAFFFFLTSNAQDWESVSQNPYNYFRFYSSSNGLTGIYDDNSNTLVTYHGSGLTGLIVRVTANLNNNTIESEEFDFMNPSSSMRGGGFDIQREQDNSFSLYGIGTNRDLCFNGIGATIFKKPLNPTGPINWRDNNFPIIRKSVYINGFNSRRNNGVSDKFGNYFFCNAGSNNALYTTNINDGSQPVNLSSQYNFDENVYIREFKKIDDGLNTHIIGIEENLTHFVYIRVNQNGQYTCARYSLSKIIDENDQETDLKIIQTETSYDLGINDQDAELIFFTRAKQIYSVNLTQNVGYTKNGKGILKYDYATSGSITQQQIDRVKGLTFIDDGKCVLITYGWESFYFNGTDVLISNCPSDNVYAHGQIVDKIYRLDNTLNSKVFLTRQNIPGIGTDFKNIRLYTIDSFNTDYLCMTKYNPSLNDHLSNQNFAHGGGTRSRAMAIKNNHLIYDGADRLIYKDLTSNNSIDNDLYLNFNATTLIPIGNDEFIAGLYYGPYIQRFRINNNQIEEKDRHLIDDDFNKITASAFDDENVYFGLYHNSQSQTDICNVYKYNLLVDSVNEEDISDPLFSVSGTNFINRMQVLSQDNKKWLYGLAQNSVTDTYKIFRKNLSDNLPKEELDLSNTLSNGDVLRDMEIINTVNNRFYLYFITNTSNKLYRINLTNVQDFENVNVQFLKNFDEKIPKNLVSFLDKHLILSFHCKETGYLTQDTQPDLIDFDPLPLTVDFTANTIIANENDKSLYIATMQSVGKFLNNNNGGVFKYELPNYMHFSHQFRHSWGLHPEDVLSGDFNGDGYDDILGMTRSGTNYWASYVWNIKLNNNQFDFANSYSFQWGSANSDFVFIGDFNGDGYDDIGVNRISDPNSVEMGEWIIRLNDGFGNFNTGYRYHWGMTPDKISIGDYNGDGFDDLAIYKYNNGWYIRLNNQSHGFENNNIFHNWSNFAGQVFSGDFNGDGYDDIGVKYSFGDPSKWLVRFNNGSMGFSNEQEYNWNTSPDFVTVGDYNNDNLTDLAVNLHSNQTSMQLGEWVFRLNYGYYDGVFAQNEFSIGTGRGADLSKKDYSQGLFILYPNPSRKSFSLSSSEEISDIEIRDINNLLILKKERYNEGDKIDISGFPFGIYFVKARIGNKYITKKLIKNN